METPPTEQEIIAAHSALFSLADFAVVKSENREQEQRMREYNNTILNVLPDKPEDRVETMADVEWDEDEHRFAEAEHPIFGKVIMLNKDIHENIECLRYVDKNIGIGYDYASSFIPTGKKYKMTQA